MSRAPWAMVAGRAGPDIAPEEEMMRNKILITTITLALAAALAMAPAAQAAGPRSPEPASFQSLASWAWSRLTSLWEGDEIGPADPSGPTTTGGEDPANTSPNGDVGPGLDPNG